MIRLKYYDYRQLQIINNIEPRHLKKKLKNQRLLIITIILSINKIIRVYLFTFEIEKIYFFT